MTNFIKDTRGYRNNNPGNIRHGNTWKGEDGIDIDSSFEDFDSIEYGIRAIYKTLCTYRNKYNTVSLIDVIYRWAPENENQTARYLSSVIKKIEDVFNVILSPVDNIWHRDVVQYVIWGIMFHENGFNPFSIDFIVECMGIE